MMWDHLLERITSRLFGNAVVQEIFQEHFRMAGPSQMQVPGIEYTILSDTTTEVWEPVLIQFDLWTSKAEDNRRGERAIRGLFDKDTSLVWDGVPLFSEYVDGAQLATPDRANYTGRGLRFLFRPMKEKLALPVRE